MKQTSLCLLVKENQVGKEILLAMKKRGFGIGKWNGVGGKLDIEKGDKNVIDTAIRETKEEIGVNIKNFRKVAVLNFYFPYMPEWDQEVHVFLVQNWQKEPIESEEMMPKWFKIKEIPFKEMWDDDIFWLPKVLNGEKLEADFTFKEGEKMITKNIKVVENFNIA
jgi:8-oxo-dGTP pyrophosphatase MutT (NUDIX family)